MEKVLLKLGRFGVDGCVGITMFLACIVQESDLGGGPVPSKINRVTTLETFKELGEEVGSLGATGGR